MTSRNAMKIYQCSWFPELLYATTTNVKKDIFKENTQRVQSSVSWLLSFWREFDSHVVQEKGGSLQSRVFLRRIKLGLSYLSIYLLVTYFIWKWPTDDISHISEQVSDMMEGLPAQKNCQSTKFDFSNWEYLFHGFWCSITMNI